MAAVRFICILDFYGTICRIPWKERKKFPFDFPFVYPFWKMNLYTYRVLE